MPEAACSTVKQNDGRVSAAFGFSSTLYFPMAPVPPVLRAVGSNVRMGVAENRPSFPLTPLSTQPGLIWSCEAGAWEPARAGCRTWAGGGKGVVVGGGWAVERPVAGQSGWFSVSGAQVRLLAAFCRGEVCGEMGVVVDGWQLAIAVAGHPCSCSSSPVSACRYPPTHHH